MDQSCAGDGARHSSDTSNFVCPEGGNMKNYLKEMSVGEIIDGSLRVYIANSARCLSSISCRS